jgi:hypothetical protein
MKLGCGIVESIMKRKIPKPDKFKGRNPMLKHTLGFAGRIMKTALLVNGFEKWY